MAAHGAVEPFDPQSKDWVLYTECLQQWFIANDVQDANKQRAVLLSMCGALTYRLICNLVTPSKPTDLNFKELVNIVKVHYSLLSSAIGDSSALYLQQPNAARGRDISRICGRALPVVGTLRLRSITG